MSNLTRRRARFVDEYLQDGNGAAAARRAGYSARSAKVTACRLLTNVNVSAAIRTRETEAARRLALTRAGATEKLLDAVDLARSQGDCAGMIRGLTTIAKVCGFLR